MKVEDFFEEKFRDMGFEEEMSQETILDLNLTSLEKVDLLLSIQEEYGIEVKLSELDNMSFKILDEYISRRIKIENEK